MKEEIKELINLYKNRLSFAQTEERIEYLLKCFVKELSDLQPQAQEKEELIGTLKMFLHNGTILRVVAEADKGSLLVKLYEKLDSILASHPEPQPQEQQKSMEQTAEEMLKDTFNPNHDIWASTTSKTIIMLMEEYASQNQSSVLPSEIEWHDAVMKLKKELPDPKFVDINTWLMACEWFKSQLKLGYPKEFVRWLSVSIAGREISLSVPVYYRMDNVEYTLDELYQYYLTNVKDK